MLSIKQFSALLILLFFVNCLLTAQNAESKIVSGKISSISLKNNVKYKAYLPSTYNSNNKEYPVLYLLHGYGGDETSWVTRCQISKLADSLINSGIISETIIIMPDAGNSFYINNYDHSVNYEDFFINELIPYIDSAYRTIDSKNYRAVCGLSMGGYGSIILSVKHPDKFGYAISLSGSLRTSEEMIALSKEKYQQLYGKVFGDSLTGNARITKLWKQNNVYNIIDSVNANQYNSVGWYIDCGMNDALISSNEAFHNLLLRYNIKHEYHMKPGEHNWQYWYKGFIDGMVFLGENWKTKCH